MVALVGVYFLEGALLVWGLLCYVSLLGRDGAGEVELGRVLRAHTLFKALD